MTAHMPLPATAGSSSGRPFLSVLALTLGVWGSALIPRDLFTSDARPFHVATGSAPALAGAIRSAPRAIVFVDEPTSTYSAAGRIEFLEGARLLARDHGWLGVRFYVVERQYVPETRAWLDGLDDERLEPLGRRMKGYGGLIWFEYGRVVDTADSVGGPGTDLDLAGRTRALWCRGR